MMEEDLILEFAKRIYKTSNKFIEDNYFISGQPRSWEDLSIEVQRKFKRKARQISKLYYDDIAPLVFK